jgi:hypothetical protein
MLVQNKYINAFILLVLFSAAIHIMLLTVFAVISNDISVLNFFNIISLNYFMEGMFNGMLSTLLSFVVVLILYGCMLFVSTKK